MNMNYGPRSRSEFESVLSPLSSGSFNLCRKESVASSNLPSTELDCRIIILVKALLIFCTMVKFVGVVDIL